MDFRKCTRWLVIGVAVGILTGCSTTKDAEVTRLNHQLQERNQEIERLNVVLEKQRLPVEDELHMTVAIDALPANAQDAATQGGVDDAASMLPPNAKPGECYARVMIPPVYETVTERLLLQEASEKLDIVPAEYEWVEEQVMVKEASQQLEVVPPVFGVAEENVLVTPESTRLEEIPAEYEWVEEEVLVKPAHTVWKKGSGPIQKVDHATGDIMCLIEVPATYKTVKKRVVKAPASSSVVTVPAEYKTVEKTVVKTPASTRTVDIPAEFKTIKVKKLLRPEEKKVIQVEAEYQTVEKQVLKSAGQLDWRRVLCETNLSGDLVTRIQTALQNLGFDSGPADGIIGPKTQAAMEAYQAKNELAVGGLTLEMLQKLGIEIP